MKRNMQMFPQDRKEYEAELEESQNKNKLTSDIKFTIINSIKVFKANYQFPQSNDNHAISKLLLELYHKFGAKFIINLGGYATLFKYVIDETTNQLVNVFIKSFDDIYLRKIYFFKNNLLDGVATLYQTKFPYLPYKLQTYSEGKLVSESELK